MNNHNTLKNKKEFDIFLLNKNNYLKTLAEFINKETLVFNVKTGKDGKVFGSISSKQIWTELDKLGYKIDKKKIVIPDALTSIGTFYVYVELYKNVTAKIKVELKK